MKNKRKQNSKGITLIALVITIIVLLILAGVSISLVVGNNGVLTQATNAVEETRKATGKEEIEMAYASVESAYWKEWAKDSSISKSDFLEDHFSDYLEGATIETDANEKCTISYNSKLYEIDENGKAIEKTGILLSTSELLLAPTDTATLTAELLELEGKINWEITEGSSSISLSATSGESITVTAVANGTAKIKATCGTKSATCNVTVASKLASVVNVGDYVNINVGYIDQTDSTDYTTSTNLKKAWRVLSKNETEGTINLISTGNPLKFRHAGMPSLDSVTEMNKVSTQKITVDSSISRGYRGNGFSTNDVKSLFNNTSVFSEIQPARYSTAGISVTSDTPDSLRKTGQYYWLGEINSDNFLWMVSPDGDFRAYGTEILGLRLVVSLVSNITITGGSGTDTAPYTLNGIIY